MFLNLALHPRTAAAVLSSSFSILFDPFPSSAGRCGTAKVAGLESTGDHFSFISVSHKHSIVIVDP